MDFAPAFDTVWLRGSLVSALPCGDNGALGWKLANLGIEAGFCRSQAIGSSEMGVTRLAAILTYLQNMTFHSMFLIVICHTSRIGTIHKQLGIYLK